ncbi:MAG: carbohydrate-binding protein, partial [Cyanobacteria bacterium P01_A01_bin.45]
MSEALFIIDPGSSLASSSTFSPGSFKLTNDISSTDNIVRVSIDFSTAIFPDLVFDPDGNAGDATAKGFTVDSGSSSIGVTSHTFLGERDGGFDILEINFNDFQPGETLEFSVDADPTSTKGTSPPGPGESGSVSGLELVGATVTVEFEDGSTLQGQVYRIPDSNTGSQVTLTSNNLTPPTIEIVGLASTAATVEDANQTVRITGTAGSEISLLIVEGAFFTEDGIGFDPDPFEANTAIAVNELTATIGANGFVDIPVTLTRSNTDGGLNYFVAKYEDGNGNTSDLSSTVVLELNSVPTNNPGTIRIEAEDYKAGTNGVEYFDTTPGNGPGAYRNDDVDIETTGDLEGEFNVGSIDTGEYLTYDVNIPVGGEYDIVLRVATASGDGKSIGVTIGGESYTSPSFNDTGGWQVYQDVTISDVNLSAGAQELRLDMTSNSFNINYIDIIPKQVIPDETAPVASLDTTSL